MRTLYTLVWYLALPLVFARLLWRSRRNPDYRNGWFHRLGRVPRISGAPIWIHAVSVGETVAAAPLVRSLLDDYPGVSILLTSTTPTGAARVRELFGDRVYHCYLPLDIPAAVTRFLRRTGPRIGVIMETEIWPNLFHACGRGKVPLVLANARLSEKSARGYHRAGNIIRGALGSLAWIAAQGEADAERFRSLGVPAERVEVTGSLKFDAEAPPDLRGRARDLRERIGPAPIWLAASTHSGEEQLVLQALAAARKTVPDLRLLLVPRHPERFAEVRDLVTQAGLRVSRRSQGWADGAAADVLLGDTMGELELFYATADFAFIGGSLVATGGHNVIEAAQCGCPFIVGPHTFNMPVIRGAFEQEDALVAVTDGVELARAVTRLARDGETRQRLAQRAGSLLAHHRGARKRLLQGIGQLMDTGR